MNNEGPNGSHQPNQQTGGPSLEEARSYAELADESPRVALSDLDHIIELLTLPISSTDLSRSLKRRLAATRALTRIAEQYPDPLSYYVGDFADVLETELDGHEYSRVEKTTEVPALSKDVQRELVYILAIIAEAEPTAISSVIDVLRTALEQFSSTDKETWTSIATALHHVANEDPNAVFGSVETIRDGLKTDELECQILAAGVLGQLAAATSEPILSDEIVEELTALLNSDHPALASMGARALADVATTQPDALVESEAVDDLVSSLETESENLEWEATLALCNLVYPIRSEGRPDAVVKADGTEKLIKLLGSETPQIRLFAVRTLQAISRGYAEVVVEAGAIRPLLSIIGQDVQQTVHATATLANIAHKFPGQIVEANGVEKLTSLLYLNQSGTGIRGEAAMALSIIAASHPHKLLEVGAVNPFKELLHSEIDQHQAEALSALGSLLPHAPDKVLDEDLLMRSIEILDSKSSLLRSNALGTIVQTMEEKPMMIADTEIVEVLGQCIHDENYRVQATTAITIGKLATTFPELIIDSNISSELGSLLSEERPDIMVSSYALIALSIIGEEKPRAVGPAVEGLVKICETSNLTFHNEDGYKIPNPNENDDRMLQSIPVNIELHCPLNADDLVDYPSELFVKLAAAELLTSMVGLEQVDLQKVERAFIKLSDYQHEQVRKQVRKLLTNSLRHFASEENIEPAQLLTERFERIDSEFESEDYIPSSIKNEGDSRGPKDLSRQ